VKQLKKLVEEAERRPVYNVGDYFVDLEHGWGTCKATRVWDNGKPETYHPTKGRGTFLLDSIRPATPEEILAYERADKDHPLAPIPTLITPRVGMLLKRIADGTVYRVSDVGAGLMVVEIVTTAIPGKTTTIDCSVLTRSHYRVLNTHTTTLTGPSE
jgi:hypothetical protein